VTASGGTVPAPKAERIVKAKTALAALAPAPQGKTGRVAPSTPPAAATTDAVAPLPVDSSRFGPRASGDSDAQTPVDQTRTASIPAQPEKPVNSGDVLPDGSVLIKAGKIPLGD
jgi:hypothetical protein